MSKVIKLNLSRDEFRQSHKEILNDVVERLQSVAPKDAKVQGAISRIANHYEGKFHVKSKIGSFVAKARARNIFALIAMLQAKIMRQMVNWKEKRFSKKRYLGRRSQLARIERIERIERIQTDHSA